MAVRGADGARDLYACTGYNWMGYLLSIRLSVYVAKCNLYCRDTPMINEGP